MASKRGGHALAAADGLLYALGGFNSVQAIPSCEVFEPEVRPVLPGALASAGAASVAAALNTMLRGGLLMPCSACLVRPAACGVGVVLSLVSACCCLFELFLLLT
jgi:hypothetical protein